MGDAGEGLVPLVRLLCQATLDDAAWGGFLQTLCALTDSAEAELFVVDSETGRCVTCISVDPANGRVGRCDRLAAGNCVWIQFGAGRDASAPPSNGPPAAAACPAPVAALTAGGPAAPNVSLFELWRHNGQRAHLALRRECTEAPDRPAALVLEQMLPFLGQAFLLTHRLAIGERRSAMLTQAVEHGATGVVLLEAQGRIVYANAAAREILDQQDGLYAENGVLLAVRKPADEALQRLLQSALRGDGLPGGTVAVPRRSGKPPYAVVAVSVQLARSTGGDDQIVCTVLIADPAASRAFSEDQIRYLYGLTPKEAKLAVLLANGETVATAAVALEVAEKTARIHLQNLFRKTGTRRQADLIRLLLAGPTAPRD